MKTFIEMLAVVNDPAAIERGYQIFAAKRDLLARQAKETSKFQHSVMEPKPLQKTYSHLRIEQEEERQSYKLAPSLGDVMQYQGAPGKFMLRLKGMPKTCTNGFHNGQLFEMRRPGFERSSVYLVSLVTGRCRYSRAVIHNKHLESVFRFDCGCINKCLCAGKGW